MSGPVRPEDFEPPEPEAAAHGAARPPDASPAELALVKLELFLESLAGTPTAPGESGETRALTFAQPPMMVRQPETHGELAATPGVTKRSSRAAARKAVTLALLGGGAITGATFALQGGAPGPSDALRFVGVFRPSPPTAPSFEGAGGEQSEAPSPKGYAEGAAPSVDPTPTPAEAALLAAAVVGTAPAAAVAVPVAETPAGLPLESQAPLAADATAAPRVDQAPVSAPAPAASSKAPPPGSATSVSDLTLDMSIEANGPTLGKADAHEKSDKPLKRRRHKKPTTGKAPQPAAAPPPEPAVPGDAPAAPEGGPPANPNAQSADQERPGAPAGRVR